MGSSKKSAPPPAVELPDPMGNLAQLQAMTAQQDQQGKQQPVDSQIRLAQMFPQMQVLGMFGTGEGSIRDDLKKKISGGLLGMFGGG